MPMRFGLGGLSLERITLARSGRGHADTERQGAKPESSAGHTTPGVTPREAVPPPPSPILGGYRLSAPLPFEPPGMGLDGHARRGVGGGAASPGDGRATHVARAALTGALDRGRLDATIQRGRDAGARTADSNLRLRRRYPAPPRCNRAWADARGRGHRIGADGLRLPLRS